jgi:hypothetical protein
MSHKLLSDARFFVFLLLIDRHIAEIAKLGRCPFCGGRLDVAHYPRKPRGRPGGLPPDFDRRFSFCCREDGCRRRVTPASIRFLDRRVYLGVITVLATTMTNGMSSSRASAIRDSLGIDWHTLRSWRQWWRDLFPQTDHGQVVRARLRQSPQPEYLFTELWRGIVTGAEDVLDFATRVVRFLVIVTPKIGLLGEEFIKRVAGLCFPQRSPKASPENQS